MTIPTEAAFPGMGAGLSKREHFAALNHAAILTAAAFNQEAEDMMTNAGIVESHEVEMFIARLAVSAADALIAALNEAPSSEAGM